MSGSNPFRRSKLPEVIDNDNNSRSNASTLQFHKNAVFPTTSNPPISGPPPPTTFVGALDSGSGASSPPAPSKSRTKKKRVKIQAPPDSPELSYSDNGGRRLSASDAATRAESPPPPQPTFDENDDDDETDSTATADSGLEEALRNTRRNSGSLPRPDASQTSGMRAPFNPFAKTVASNEVDIPARSVEDEAIEHRQFGSGRPALDVEAFKNILMTGSATPSPPTGRAGNATTANSGFPRQQENSSSTDTSSLFDPNYSIQPESPRTSFDDYGDASGSEDDNENSNLMGQGRLDDLAPPAPPKPNKPRGPQTVSFADFDQSIPPGFQSSGPPTPPVNAPLAGILRPSVTRTSSDLNKPLPPPPKSPADPPLPAIPPTIEQPSLPVVSAVDDTISQKRPPPPPPAARRKADHSRGRSVSNMSNETQDSSGNPDADDHVSIRSVETSNKSTPPPPPPARKVQSLNHSTGTSPPSSIEGSPSQSTTDVLKAVPPPPPRRQPSRLGRSENNNTLHPPEQTSRSQSQKPGDAFLSSLVPANPPPAPPPRRAGGSKRTSLDGYGERPNADQLRKSSGNSVESEAFVQAPEQAVVMSPESQRDILADMSAFQAEIDALRARSEGQGSRD